MRLETLAIKGFKNLRNFEIDFRSEEVSPFTVLVGRNGSGKSNLLEALVVIFRDLDLGQEPSFAFKLQYQSRGTTVEIDADPTRTRDRVTVKVAGEIRTYSRFHRDNEKETTRLLPNFVFGYYSGPSGRFEQHFSKHQEIFYKESLNNEDVPLRRLFYARLVHSQFVLLSFFVKDDPGIQDFLRQRLGILGLASILFVLKEPPWDSKEGDQRFWKARGRVQDFLDKLYALALAPLRLQQRVEHGIKKTKTLEHLYLFLPSQEQFQQLASSYSDPREFFKTLESTYISELLKEIRVSVRIENCDGTVTFRELSEGEQQLLMVLGLLRFTNEDESLFLLDEPDTHLNPAWSIRYLETIEKVVGNPGTSHILMATHEPLVFAALKKSQVRIMRRNQRDGQISAELPEQDPRGMGVAAILTSDLFELESTLDSHTLQKLKRRRELAAQSEPLTNEEKQEIRALDEELGLLDLNFSMRDPLYQTYLKALAQYDRSQLDTRPLTPEARKRQVELTRNIVQRLRQEGKI